MTTTVRMYIKVERLLRRLPLCLANGMMGFRCFTLGISISAINPDKTRGPVAMATVPQPLFPTKSLFSRMKMDYSASLNDFFVLFQRFIGRYVNRVIE